MRAFNLLDDQIDIDEMPLCPCCDQPMFWYTPVCIGKLGDMLALVHMNCAEEFGEEIPEA